MKLTFFIFIICTLYSICCSAQENVPLKAAGRISQIINYEDDNKVKIYSTDYRSIDTLVSLSTKKYKIVFFYAFWCESSTKTLPVILDYIGKHPGSFDIFLVAADPYERLPYYEKYLSGQLQYFKPTFILDEALYGNKRTVKKIKKVITELCSECDAKKMAFSSFIVYDTENKFVVHTGWKFDSEEKVRVIKALEL